MMIIGVPSGVPSKNPRDDRSQLETWQARVNHFLGVSPSYDAISPAGTRRPPVHVILIDALDECGDVDQRSALGHSPQLGEDRTLDKGHHNEPS